MKLMQFSLDDTSSISVFLEEEDSKFHWAVCENSTMIHGSSSLEEESSLQALTALHDVLGRVLNNERSKECTK